MLILFFQNTKKFSLFHKKGTESSSETLKEHSLPICLTECLIGTDIAFLLDGSGSVNRQDFQKMKTFVKNLVGSFLSSDTKVRNCTAILSQTQTLQVHVAFLNFHKNMFFFLMFSTYFHFPLISLCMFFLQFSVSQFSHSPKVHYYFNNFFSSGSWKSNIDRITQLRGGTYTAKAIEHAV